MVSQGRLHTLHEHAGFIAVQEQVALGFAIYRIDADPLQAELLAIRALQQWRGIGSALMTHLEDHLKKQAVETLWLCTTNDNLDALRFYQQRGFHLTQLVPGAFDEVRRIKGLPGTEEVIGNYGIPIRDELVLTKQLLASTG